MTKQTPNVSWEDIGCAVRLDIGAAKYLCNEMWVLNWYRDSYKGAECPSAVDEAVTGLTEHFTQIVETTINKVPKGLANRIFVIRRDGITWRRRNEPGLSRQSKV